MKRKLTRLRCRITGHTDPQLVAGVREGQYIKARICKRCHYVFESQWGSRAVRRAHARRL